MRSKASGAWFYATGLAPGWHRSMIQVTANVPCPTCGAGKNDPCEKYDGAVDWHDARKVAANARLTELRRGPAKLYEWTELPDYPGCLCIAGLECTIWLQKRPGWCDRGRWSATLDAWGRIGVTIDHQDAWPRYYMNLTTAKFELFEWIMHRENSLIEDSAAGRGPDKNPLCIVCGVHATPLQLGEIYILLCTRHGLEFVYRMGAVTLQMLRDHESASPHKPE
jgi:hypothetical protein